MTNFMIKNKNVRNFSCKSLNFSAGASVNMLFIENATSGHNFFLCSVYFKFENETPSD